jgi:putative Mg2+ transporter-C (MgtC) family protein
MEIVQPSTLTLVLYLAVALLLSSAIGLEREFRQKSAGLRTNTLVGLGAAVFMVISKYGFFDVLQPGVTIDPARVAAQIVTGIGFIGGGIIFVRRSDVHGLTTAAGVWLTAAVGMAAGAGLLAIAVMVTGVYYLVALLYPVLVERIRRSRAVPHLLELHYIDGRGVLRRALSEVSRQGFDISEVSVAHEGPYRFREDGSPAAPDGEQEPVREVSVVIEVEGRMPTPQLAASLGQIQGVVSVSTEDVREEAA